MTVPSAAHVGLLAAVLTLLVLHPLPVALSHALPYNLGDPLLNAWILGWTSDRLWHGMSGLWDAPIFFPNENTLAYSEHLLGVTALVAPVYWLTGNGILTHNLAIFLSFVIAAVSMYLLTHALTGHRHAAVVAAVAFAFSPFRVGGQLARVQMMMSCWLPLALWGLHRYGATGRVRFLAIGTAGYLLLALSNTYLAFYSAPAIALVAATCVWRRRPPRLRAALQLAASAAMVVLVLAPVVAQYAAVKHEHDVRRSPNELHLYSADLLSYVSVSRHPLADWLRYEGTADRALFPGLVLTALAIVGVVTSRPRPPRRCSLVVPLYVAVAALAIVLSFGPTLVLDHEPTGVRAPYAWLLAIAPGLDAFRAPGRFAAIAITAGGVLAAVGARQLMAGRGPVVRAALVAAAVVAVVAEAYPGPVPTASFRNVLTAGQQRAYEWLRTARPAAVLVLPAARRTSSGFDDANVSPTLVYQYAGLRHGLPLVNGSSGFTPALTERLTDEESPFTRPASIPPVLADLAACGVGYVLVHVHHYRDSAHSARVVDAIRAAPVAAAAQRFDDTWVFALSNGSVDAAVHQSRSARPPGGCRLLGAPRR